MAAPSCDVAIIGGGPAGTAAALTLRRYTSRSVVLLERSAYGEARIGETVSSALLPLLEYLGVRDAFLADAHLPGYATSAAWNSDDVTTRDFFFTGRGHGWHLDRQRFDAMLAREAASSGAQLRTLAHARSCERDGDGWRIAVSDGAELRARVVIDASGKAATIARRMEMQSQVFDHLVGQVAYAEPVDSRQAVLVEAVPEGWWYSALLPDSRLVLVLMTDADLVRGAWDEALARAPHTRARVRRIEGGEPFIRDAHSHVLMPAAGNGWIAAGDAAASFDPLSSMGIGHAIASGVQAARVAHESLEGDPDAIGHYARDVVRQVNGYLTLRHQHYAIEQRWPDAPFWRRRHRWPVEAD